MAKAKKVKIRYVGHRAFRADNICGTHAIWTADKPVAEVDEEVAVRLCQYPTVWQIDGPKVSRPTAPVLSEPPPILDAVEEGATEAEAFQALGEEMAGDNLPDQAPPTAPTGEPVTTEEVSEILTSLDKDKDFSSKGKPLVDSVRSLFPGRPVAMKEVKAAWDAFEAK